GGGPARRRPRPGRRLVRGAVPVRARARARRAGPGAGEAGPLGLGALRVLGAPPVRHLPGGAPGRGGRVRPDVRARHGDRRRPGHRRRRHGARRLPPPPPRRHRDGPLEGAPGRRDGPPEPHRGGGGREGRGGDRRAGGRLLGPRRRGLAGGTGAPV
ncbi:MAG: Phenazine biosynthesis protein PhzF like, partial [uncultured Rubrobacteraceae bacterium]